MKRRRFLFTFSFVFVFDDFDLARIVLVSIRKHIIISLFLYAADIIILSFSLCIFVVLARPTVRVNSLNFVCINMYIKYSLFHSWNNKIEVIMYIPWPNILQHVIYHAISSRFFPKSSENVYVLFCCI